MLIGQKVGQILTYLIVQTDNHLETWGLFYSVYMDEITELLRKYLKILEKFWNKLTPTELF